MKSFFQKSGVVAAIFSWAAFSGGASAALPQAQETSPTVYGELLAKYATPQGVRYSAWHENAADLDALKGVVDFYATTLPPAGRDASLAWHINAYNSWILHSILKKYPTKGPLDKDEKFFEDQRITVSGKKLSFNDLEQKLIRPVFQEPRVHFALNCASESCPPLSTRPFTAESLESDLESLTRAFINQNPRGVVPGKGGVQVSKVFDWYADDFGGKDQVVTYINRYRDIPIPVGAKVGFFDYSWKLNAVK